jgi:transposase
MAKSVLDSGWGMLKQMLQYKGEHAGRSVQVVSERNTSAACSSCGALSGPRGANGLAVRRWICSECGDSHDRDVNAARLILLRGEVSLSVRGNEPSPSVRQPSQVSHRCAAGIGTLEVPA